MCNPEEDGDDGNSYETQPFFIPKVLKASGTLVIERLPLFFEGYTYAYGHIAYIHGRPPAPVILVHPNYAGLKQFDIDQAAFLARAGYVGVAVDLYREREMVGVSDESLEYLFEDRDPKRDLTFFGQSSGYMSERQKEKVKRHSAGSFAAMTGLLKTPIVWRALMAAWLDKARCHPAVHRVFAGAIGYCFGGQAVLEQVRAGHSIQAAVTFHGLLHSRPRRVESVRGNGYDGRMSAEEAELVSGIISSCLKAQGRNLLLTPASRKRRTFTPPNARCLLRTATWTIMCRQSRFRSFAVKWTPWGSTRGSILMLKLHMASPWHQACGARHTERTQIGAPRCRCCSFLQRCGPSFLSIQFRPTPVGLCWVKPFESCLNCDLKKFHERSKLMLLRREPVRGEGPCARSRKCSGSFL
mmetsp:Transcript_31430/g.73716  ORF Transcript_31430/g.73716 Transcript_31430/m.73716 type:complete len:412 (-) Transcript_31430:36-1271(-)